MQSMLVSHVSIETFEKQNLFETNKQFMAYREVMSNPIQ